jgi:hypothetical protein
VHRTSLAESIRLRVLRPWEATHYNVICPSHPCLLHQNQILCGCCPPISLQERHSSRMAMVSCHLNKQLSSYDPLFINQSPRPSLSAVCIHPSTMQDHCVSHRMLGPNCLCPMVDANKPDFIEAAIYKASVSEQAGQYVATCVKDECGYYGEQLSGFMLFCFTYVQCPWRDSMTRQALARTMVIEVSNS